MRPSLSATSLLPALYVALALSSGCASTSPAEPPTPSACTTAGGSAKSGSGASYGLAAATAATPTATKPRSITFYDDLLPILASNVDGAKYRCTICHAHYAEPGGLNSADEVESITTAMRDGRMPRGGDAVPERYVQLFEQWRLTGFTPGTPRTDITTSDTTDTTGTSSAKTEDATEGAATKSRCNS